MPLIRQSLRRFLALALCGLLLAPSALAASAELKPKTLEVFEHYVSLREAQIQEELRRPGANPFLWVDTLPAARRQEAYAELKEGEVTIERPEVRENGKKIEIDDGIIHHWMGTVFIPGVTLKQTIALLQDYDNHEVTYSPDVMESKLLEREGNHFKIFMRFLKKKVITVVLNTEQDVRYVPLTPTRMYCVAKTTRIAEVEDAGKPDEREKPVGNDGGFMWRLYTYWLFEERDGGVYVQCEAISLSRSIPFLLKWLKPFITSVPRESLQFTLETTRQALTGDTESAGSR